MPSYDGLIGSQILDEGKTPAQWVKILAERGVIISERTLREKANEFGAYYRLGRTMLITSSTGSYTMPTTSISMGNPYAKLNQNS